MNTTKKEKIFVVSNETNPYSIIYKLKEYEQKFKNLYKNAQIESTDYMYDCKKILKFRHSLNNSFNDLFIQLFEFNSFVFSVPFLKNEYENKINQHSQNEKENTYLYKFILKIIQKHRLLEPKEKQVGLRLKATSAFYYFHSLSYYMSNFNNTNLKYCFDYGILNFYYSNLYNFFSINKQKDVFEKEIAKLINRKEYKKLNETINFASLSNIICFTSCDFDTFYCCTDKEFLFSLFISIVLGVNEQLQKAIIEKHLVVSQNQLVDIEKNNLIKRINENKYCEDLITILNKVSKDPTITINKLSEICNLSEETIKNRLKTICSLSVTEEKSKGIETVKNIIKKYSFSSLDFYL